MAPDDTDPDVRDLRERVSELETDKQKLRARLDDQQETIQRLMPSRRQALAGAGLLGGGLLGGRLSTGTARAEAAGQVGTETDPVDVQAWDLNVQNSVTSDLPMGGNDVTDVGAMDVDSQTINNELIARGLDTAPVGSEIRLFSFATDAQMALRHQVITFAANNTANTIADNIQLGGILRVHGNELGGGNNFLDVISYGDSTGVSVLSSSERDTPGVRSYSDGGFSIDLAIDGAGQDYEVEVRGDSV